MVERKRPPAEEIVLYEKDPRTKIATVTLNRPDELNSLTIAARQRFAQLVHRANTDDEVKVLVLRGLGGIDFVGGDLVEVAPQYDATTNTAHAAAQVMYLMNWGAINNSGLIES